MVGVFISYIRSDMKFWIGKMRSGKFLVGMDLISKFSDQDWSDIRKLEKLKFSKQKFIK